MIKVENLEVLNFEGALRGMRNPWNLGIKVIVIMIKIQENM